MPQTINLRGNHNFPRIQLFLEEYPTPQRAKTHFFSLKKSGQNAGGQNIAHLFWGTFGVQISLFGRLFKILGELSLSWSDTFPLFSSFPISFAALSNVSKNIDGGKKGTLMKVELAYLCHGIASTRSFSRPNVGRASSSARLDGSSVPEPFFDFMIF